MDKVKQDIKVNQIEENSVIDSIDIDLTNELNSMLVAIQKLKNEVGFMAETDKKHHQAEERAN